MVKLGTITPAGADVYSYAGDENDLVLDPQLKKHLAHWGIDMDTMEKTAKTMAELQARPCPGSDRPRCPRQHLFCARCMLRQARAVLCTCK